VRTPDTCPGAAVVGAGGFIGSHLTAALRASDMPVAAFTRERPCLADGVLDPALRAARTIFYLATTIVPATAGRDPHRATRDRLAFDALLDALERDGLRPAVVLASTGGMVYDASVPRPCDEYVAARGLGEYGQAKRHMEQSLLWRAGTLKPVVLRLSNVYGPGQQARAGQGVVAYWLEAAATGAVLQLYGDPAAIRDFVYVDDVVDAMLRLHRISCGPGARETLASTQVLNIGSGRPVCISGLLEIVCQAVGRDLPVERMPRRTTDGADIWLNVGRAARMLGWRPRTDLPTGVLAAWRARQLSNTHPPVLDAAPPLLAWDPDPLVLNAATGTIDFSPPHSSHLETT
jgi:UDP-glucose 4-epimerase